MTKKTKAKISIKTSIGTLIAAARQEERSNDTTAVKMLRSLIESHGVEKNFTRNFTRRAIRLEKRVINLLKRRRWLANLEKRVQVQVERRLSRLTNNA